MDYRQLLENSFEKTKEYDCYPPEGRLKFLANYVFDLTTYDTEIDNFLANRILEACAAIINRTTFRYIEHSADNYRWFITVCNLPFFKGKLNWGSSIRGCWFDTPIHSKKGSYVNSYGLYEGDKQLDGLELKDRKELEEFMSAVIEFGAVEEENHDPK